MLECLKNIVALSRNECECFGLPTDTSEPCSGIFLDEIAGGGLLKMLFCSNQCGVDFHTKANQLIEQATQCFLGDFRAYKARKFSENPQLFKMRIIGGKHEHKATVLDKNMAVLKVCAKGFKNGRIKLDNIGLSPFADGTNQRVELCKEIKIYDWNGCEVPLPDTIEIKTDKRKIVWADFSEPIILPLDGECTCCYYITYQNCGNNPLRTYDWCGCGTKKPKWMRTLAVDAFKTDTVETFESCKGNCNRKGQSDTYGLHARVSLECDEDALLCCLFNDNKALQSQAYMAIAYKAIEMIINDLISQNILNYTTIAARKNWLGNIASVRASYQQLTRGGKEHAGIADLIDMNDTNINGCLCLKKGFTINKRFTR